MSSTMRGLPSLELFPGQRFGLERKDGPTRNSMVAGERCRLGTYKQLQRTVTDKVPSHHLGQRATAELRRYAATEALRVGCGA
jgi:hypothetical protein